MKVIFSPQTLITIEKVGAFIADAHVEAARQLRILSKKVEDVAFDTADYISDKCLDFRAASHEFAGKVKLKYAQRMRDLVKHQAAARHERLAWVALEKPAWKRRQRFLRKPGRNLSLVFNKGVSW